MEGRYIPKTNTEFWVNKIQSNIDRDKRVNNELEDSGWIVIRFWAEEINNVIDECVDEIIKTLNISPRKPLV